MALQTFTDCGNEGALLYCLLSALATGSDVGWSLDWFYKINSLYFGTHLLFATRDLMRIIKMGICDTLFLRDFFFFKVCPLSEF